MTPNRMQLVKQVLRKRQWDLTMLADRVSKSHNLGALVRTADAVGCSDFHFLKADRNQVAFEQFLGTSKGSSRWVNLHCHERFEDAIGTFRDRGMQVLAADLNPQAVDFREVDYTKPTCIVVGKESTGVSDSVLAHADQVVSIPIVGMVESLNVSVASALILYEAQRQRQLAGLYDRCALTEAEIDLLLLQKEHPAVYDFCLKHKIPFPCVDENGDLQGDTFHAARRAVLDRLQQSRS